MPDAASVLKPNSRLPNGRKSEEGLHGVLAAPRSIPLGGESPPRVEVTPAGAYWNCQKKQGDKIAWPKGL
jgi:hypothetical protein